MMLQWSESRAARRDESSPFEPSDVVESSPPPFPPVGGRAAERRAVSCCWRGWCRWGRGWR